MRALRAMVGRTMVGRCLRNYTAAKQADAAFHILLVTHCPVTSAGFAIAMSSPSLPPHHNAGLAGVLSALGAFLFWGLATPVYFKEVRHIAPMELLAHRVIWSVVLLLLVVLILRGPAALLRALNNRRQLIYCVATTLLVSTNWLIFIWAVATDHLVDSSLGYYINPLVNVLLGVLFLEERLSRYQTMAVGVATLGVAVQVVMLGILPWVALALAFSFGFYGLLRKKADIDPLVGLLVETLLLLPLALAFAWYYGSAFTLANWQQDVVLMGAGVITAVPLVLFLFAAQHLRLSTLGVMQYLAPTGHLAIAVLAYGEPFTPTQGFTFLCVWMALALYSYDLWRKRRTVPSESKI